MATECNTKNRVTGYKKQTPKTTPIPQLDVRAAILFPNTSSPLYFHAVASLRPPPGPARPVLPPGRHRIGLTGAVGGGRPAASGTGASRSALPRHGGRRAGTGGTAPPGGTRGAAGPAGRGGGRGEGEESSWFPLVAAAARLRGEEPRGRGIRTAGPRGGESAGRPGPPPSERPGTGGDRSLARLPGVPSAYPPSRDSFQRKHLRLVAPKCHPQAGPAVPLAEHRCSRRSRVTGPG